MIPSVSPFTITHVSELRFPEHPMENGDSDTLTFSGKRDSRSIWVKLLHFVPLAPDQYSENKVFSHSESSLHDILLGPLRLQ